MQVVLSTLVTVVMLFGWGAGEHEVPKRQRTCEIVRPRVSPLVHTNLDNSTWILTCLRILFVSISTSLADIDEQSSLTHLISAT